MSRFGVISDELVEKVGAMRAGGATKAQIRDELGLSEGKVDACWRLYRERHGVAAMPPGGMRNGKGERR